MDYKFKILDFENYDGDSFELELDLGFGITLRKKCRILGIDTPELRGGTEQSKAAGQLAKKYAYRFADSGNVYFHSQALEGKFGRPLGDIVTEFGAKLSDHLLDSRLAVAYHGQAKADVQAEHDKNIKYLVEKGLIE